MNALSYLPPPDNGYRVMVPAGNNTDIRNVIQRSFPSATSQVKVLAPQFKGATALDTARNIWLFLRSQVQYQKDHPAYQLIRLPSRFIRDGKGDCKSYSLFTAGILASLKMPVAFRYASYDIADPTPSHVYTVTKDEIGNDIIIDGVYNRFNRESPYKYKQDKDMTQVAVLSGLEKRTPGDGLRAFLNKSETKKSPTVVAIIQSAIARLEGKTLPSNYTPEQLKNHQVNVERLIKNWAGRGTIWQLIQRENNMLNQGVFAGYIPGSPVVKGRPLVNAVEDQEIGKLKLKKLWSKIKRFNPAFAVSRKAFLTLVQLNIRGLAIRLHAAPKSGLIKIWEKVGGNPSHLMSSIAHGRKRRPIFGEGKKTRRVKQINGICEVSDNDGIGEAATGATIATIVAAAAPILVLVVAYLTKQKVPDVKDPAGGGSSSDILSEALKAGGDLVSNAVQSRLNSGSEGGGAPLTPQEQAVDNAIPKEGDDNKILGLPAPVVYLGGGLIAAKMFKLI